MDLHHEFTVPVPASDAWLILTDLERLAPCLPGAQLTEVEGETYRGQVKVKVGPILAQFKGQASFVSRDDSNFLASLKAEGRDTGGKGNASAIITAKLEAVSATSAKCTVDTQLSISGKVAQFGRGALADVSDKLLLQFVANLNTLIASQPNIAASSGSVPPPTPSSHEAPTVRKIEQTTEVAPLNLLDTAGSTIVKRLLPVVLVVAVALLGAFVVLR